MNSFQNRHFILEMTMQEVLDNMTELTTEMSWLIENGGFEILSIQPPEQADKTPIIPFVRLGS